MSEWKLFKMSEIADVVGGGTPSTSNPEYWNGDIPWLTPKDLTGYTRRCIGFGERNITPIGLRNSSSRLLPPNTVLLTSRAPIGYVAITENALCTNQGFKSLILNSKIADNVYVYYWLKGNTEYLNQLGTGTTFAEISGAVVKDIDIKLPPLAEQEAIAEVLSSLDDKIDLLHRNNKTLEEMAETLFWKWFVVDSNENWKVMTLSDVAYLHNGKTRPGVEEGSIPIYGGNGILGYTNTHNFAGKSIIIGRVGAYCGSLYYEDREVWVSDNALLLKAKSEALVHYLFYLLRTKDLNSMAEGSSHPLLTQTLLKSLEVTIPPIDVIETFNNQVEAWNKKVETNKLQISCLEVLRNMLLPKLMSGAVRVNTNNP